MRLDPMAVPGHVGAARRPFSSSRRGGVVGVCLPVATQVTLKSHALDPMATPIFAGAVHRLDHLSRRGV